MKKNSLFRLQGSRVSPAIPVALTALLLGFLYYGLFRDHSLYGIFPAFFEHRSLVTQWLPLGYEIQWLPSFLHAFATLLFAQVILSAGSSRERAWCRAGILFALVAFELFIGVTDKFDLVAILAAAALAEFGVGFLHSKSCLVVSQGTIRKTIYHRMSLLGVVGFSGLLAAGSTYDGTNSGGGSFEPFEECARFEGGSCIEFVRSAAPEYMTYQELRESVSVEPGRAPASIGRVYLYQNYVLLNERNAGIHIIDNSDPAAPVNLGFISIPGNTDIAMRSNYLYADSYIDLITFDLSDPANVQVISRQEDLFPYDAYQNIPYNISFRENGFDSRLGVVVSYQLLEN